MLKTPFNWNVFLNMVALVSPWLNMQHCIFHALLLFFSTESISLPPQLPPRNFTSNEGKDSHGDTCRGMERGAEPTRPSISDTYLQRLQQIDISKYNEIHLSYTFNCLYILL